MIPLDQIRIASPCHADWKAMTGTDQIRFCGQCRKNVYNLSEMTRTEAQRVVEEHEGRLCVRFYTRADGTLLTQDCPVGVRTVRYRRTKKLSYAAVLLSVGAGLLRGAGAVTVVRKPLCPAAIQPPVKSAPTTHRMGKIAVPPRQSPAFMVGEISRPMMGVPPDLSRRLWGSPCQYLRRNRKFTATAQEYADCEQAGPVQTKMLFQRQA